MQSWNLTVRLMVMAGVELSNHIQSAVCLSVLLGNTLSCLVFFFKQRLVQRVGCSETVLVLEHRNSPLGNSTLLCSCFLGDDCTVSQFSMLKINLICVLFFFDNFQINQVIWHRCKCQIMGEMEMHNTFHMGKSRKAFWDASGMHFNYVV